LVENLQRSCTEAVAERMRGETGAWVREELGRPEVQPVDRSTTLVQGVLRADTPQGPGDFDYRCTFRSDLGYRLADVTYRLRVDTGGGAEYRTVCRRGVDARVRTDALGQIGRYLDSAEVLQIDPRTVRVRGNAEVLPRRGGPATRITYQCAFRADQGNRLVDVAIRGIEAPAPPDDSELDRGNALTARLLRQRCREALQDQVLRRGDGEISGWRGDGDFRDLDGRLRTLGGEMLIRAPQGRDTVHRYSCTFRLDQDNELTDAEYGRSGVGDPGEELPLLLRNQCRSSVETTLARREGARVESWRGDGIVREVGRQVTRVEGGMIVRPRGGRQTPYTYACSFQADQEYRLADVEYGPAGAWPAGRGSFQNER